MKSINIKKFGLIFFIGLIGIATIAFSELPLPEVIKEEILQHTSKEALTLLILINPAILLLIMTLIGISLQPKTILKTPIIDRIVGLSNEVVKKDFLITGIVLGLLTGIMISVWTYLFTPYLPESIINLNENIKLSVLTRFLYGGVTEEILLRFGFMTLLVWLFVKIKNTNLSYWGAILISSLLFGVGHLPIVFSTVDNINNILVLYIILGNTIGGVAYGWLYWKKGLESAMIAHIITHLTLLTIQ